MTKRVFALFLVVFSSVGMIPVYAIDTFDSGLDGWVYTGTSGYSLSNNNGMAHISGDAYSINAGAEKTFDVSNAGSVTLSFDWRASSGCSCSSTTNFRLMILDTSGNILSSQSLQLGGTIDTGIKSYSADITGIISGHDIIVIRMWLNDSWSSNWNQKIWWDDVDLQVTQSQQDITPPTLTIPSDVTAEATGQQTTVNIGTATATDNIDPNPTITNNATLSFPVGTTKILWTATDSSNNYSTDIQTITIQDATPPTLTIPSDITVESTGSSTAVFIGSATANDLVDSNPIITHNSTGTFPIGSTAILWTVTDSFGNSNNAIQTITVQDTTPPTIILNGDNPQTIQLGSGYTELGATTNDGSQVTIDSSSFVDSLGSYSVFYDSVDAYGNDAIQVVRTVNVVGPTPTLTIPDDITIEATGQFTTVDIGIATATDDIDPNPTITNNSTSTFPVGITAILWTATNSIGNQDVAIQTITVTDTTPPIITAPDDMTVEVTGQTTTISIGTATATDSVDASPTITNNATNSFPVGNTIILWTATDDSGNESTATQTITVYGGAVIVEDAATPNPLVKMNEFFENMDGLFFGLGIFTIFFLFIGFMASPKTVHIYTIIIMIFAGILNAMGVFAFPAWMWGVMIFIAIVLVFQRKRS